MNKQVSALLIALACVTSSSPALADSLTADNAPTVQIAARNQVTPIMSHEVATLIKFTHQAEAQYRRTGSPQDLARVKAMRIELANRGFGPSTQTAPTVMATYNQFNLDLTQRGVVVSSAE